MAWARNGTPVTLGIAGDDMDINDLTAKKFNQFLIHGIDNGSNIGFDLTFDNNGNTDYARRYSVNGAADVTGTSLSYWSIQSTSASDGFFIVYGINIDGEEKLFMAWSCEPSTAGAGTAPARMEIVGKVDTSTNSGQFTDVDCNNSLAGSYDTGSNLSVLTGDETEVAVLPKNLQSGSRFEATDTRKIYYGALPSVTFEDDFSGTDDWTDSDSTIVGVNTTTDVLDFKEKDGNFEEVSFYDITALGTDPSFVFRCKYNVGTLVQSGNTDSVRITLGLSTGGDIGEGVGRDEVAVVWRVTNTINKWYAFVADGVGNNYSGTDFTTAVPSTTGGDGSGNYWFEIIGNGGTYTFNIYSDEYSSLIESEQITDAGLTGLNKIVLRSLTLTTTNNQARGYIDDVKFYNGVTSTDFTWTEEA